MRTTTVYVLHFDPPYRAPVVGSPGRFKTAGHYVGSTAGPVAQRLEQHLSGRGSPLVRAAVAQGSRVILANSFPGGRVDERRIKNSHHRERWCPICRPVRAAVAAGKEVIAC